MKKIYPVIFAFCSIIAWSPPLMALPVPGGTLDPTTIPKYVIPLVIPPVMKDNGTAEPMISPSGSSSSRSCRAGSGTR